MCPSRAGETVSQLLVLGSSRSAFTSTLALRSIACLMSRSEELIAAAEMNVRLNVYRTYACG